MGLSELFENPKVLLLLPFLLPVLFYTGKEWAGRAPSLWGYQKASRIRVFLGVRMPYWLLVGILAVAIIAVANPQAEKMGTRTHTYGYRVAICIDRSGSMADQNKLESAKQAASDFVMKRDKDAFAFLPFDDSALLGSAVKFTTDRALIVQAISGLTTGGGTVISEGYLGALVLLLNDVVSTDPTTGKKEFSVRFDLLKESLAAPKGSEAYAYREELKKRIGRIEGAFLLCVTDAENSSSDDPMRVIDYAAALGISSFLVSVGTQQDKLFIRSLEQSGGGYYFASSEKDIQLMTEKINIAKPAMIFMESVPVPVSRRPLLAKIIGIMFILMVVLFVTALRIR